MYDLLKKNQLPFDIEIHSDPLCILPAALSNKRAFKLNKIVQDIVDDPGGPEKCRLCNPHLLDGNPEIERHENGRVISFPNAAPFLPGDQRVLALWHEEPEVRYRHAHKVQFVDFGIEEFYYLTKATVGLAKAFPESNTGKVLQRDPNLIRSVAGFNIGKFAGQSLPHFHLQYGWEIVLEQRFISPPRLNLYYEEMRDAKLILLDEEDMYVVVPWAPKGQYHVEIHFKNVYHLCDLRDDAVSKLAYFANSILDLYKGAAIKNVNILFTSSPHRMNWEPLRVQFVPRANVTAFYEMIGINVVDTTLEQIVAFFTTNIRWSDVARKAKEFDPSNLYENRFCK